LKPLLFLFQGLLHLIRTLAEDEDAPRERHRFAIGSLMFDDVVVVVVVVVIVSLTAGTRE